MDKSQNQALRMTKFKEFWWGQNIYFPSFFKCIPTCVKVIPDFKKELVAAAVGESAAKVSDDIGAVPDMKKIWVTQQFSKINFTLSYFE